ncbi:MAG TPA: hypothetical protein VFD82_05770 [Planctomycetota bacterium]|nr:hypothetical protein [Planctomycetota bacterium]
MIAPPLCGPLNTLPLLGTLGPNVTGGIMPCDGTTNFNILLPVAPALAGAVLSSQCVTICIGGTGFGFGMSNCLSWQLQGNTSDRRPPVVEWTWRHGLERCIMRAPGAPCRPAVSFSSC